jgi:hypothetical protein
MCKDKGMQVEVRHFYAEKPINWQTVKESDLWCMCDPCYIALVAYCLERWKKGATNDTGSANTRTAEED